jgi:hypothetical protein
MHRLPDIEDQQELAAGEEAGHIEIYHMACSCAAGEPQLH